MVETAELPTLQGILGHPAAQPPLRNQGFPVTTTPTVGQRDAKWMAERRAEAASAVTSLSMPTPREETWRYIDLDFDPRLDAFAETPGPALSPDAIVDGWAGNVVTVVDGFAADPSFPLVTESSEDRLLTKEADLFAAAYTAFAPGAVLLAGDVLAAPVLVDVQTTGAMTTFPGVHIDVPNGADASVVVRLRSGSDDPAVVVPRLTASVGDNARLTLSVVQDWNYATRSLARAIVKLGRDAGLTLAEAGIGGLMSRLHLDVDFVGNGSHAKIYGAYFGEDDQTLDYRYFMNHIGTNTRCDMFLKGAVEDDALSVFTGLIRIEETGQKTESFQTNRNLILSSGASAQSVPNLEILANDVKCGHGSSVGPLDQDQRYYLMSRGLTPERADRLQVRGFFEEVVSAIPDETVADLVRTKIISKYVTAQEEGRV